MSNIKLLLIDDSDTAREGVAAYLKNIGDFEITEYDNGASALEHLKAHWRQYTVVLLDFVLPPPTSGEKVLQTIRKKYPHLPIIVFTGRDPSGGIHTLEMGAYQYMQRPLNYPEMVNAIRELSNQDMIFHELVRDVRQILKFDISIAWRLDRQNHQFYIAAWDGAQGVKLEETYRQNAILPLQGLMHSNLFQEKHPIFISDIRDETQGSHFIYRKEAVQQGWISLISITLFYENQIIGLIDSYTYKIFHFADESTQHSTLQTLHILAKQIAKTIRTENLSNQLQALHEINKLLAGTFEEKAIIRQILAKSLELVGADASRIYLWNSDRSKLELVDSLGISDKALISERGLSEEVIGQVAKTGNTLNVPNVRNDERHKSMPGFGLGSEVAIPLRQREQTVGVLAVKNQFTNAFNDSDIDLLISLATQAAIAIERAKLARHSQGVSHFALTKEFKDLANYVVEAVKDLTGADVNLWMMSEKAGERGQYLRIIASKGTFSQGFVQESRLSTDPDVSIHAKVLQEKRPIIRADIQDDTENPKFAYMEEAAKQGWHSFMSVPLLGRDNEPIGVLSLYSTLISRFGDPDAEMMQTFANQVATAFQQQKRSSVLEKLAQISQTLTENTTTEPNQLLEQAAQIAQDLTQADSVSIYSYDPIRRGFYQKNLIAAVGIINPLFAVADKPKIDGLASLIQQEEVIVVHDIDQGDVRIGWDQLAQSNKQSEIHRIIHEAKFIEKEGIKAFIGIALRVYKRSSNLDSDRQDVGILYIDFRTPHNFSSEELRITRIYANQVTNIIKGARFYIETERQANELQAVQQTALKIVGQSTDLDSVLNSLVNAATNILRGKGGILYLRFPDEEISEQEVLKLVAVRGIESEILKPGFKMALNQGLTGKVLQAQQTLIVDDYSKWPDHDKRIAELFTAVIEAPLFLENEVIGVIGVFDNVTQRTFTESDKPILERLAQQASLAIHHARLFTNNQSRLNFLRALEETSLDIVKQLDWEELMPTVIDRAERLMTSKNTHGIGGAYWRCDYERGKAIIDYSRNPAFKNIEVNLDQGLIGEVIRTGRAQYKNAFHKWPLRPTLFDNPSLGNLVKNLIEVPIKEGNKIIGIIAITDATGQHFFNEEHCELLERFADLTAIAMQNARLVQQERTLREVSTAISTNLDIQKVTGKILDELKKVKPFHKATIQQIQGNERSLLAWRGFNETQVDFWLLRPIPQDLLLEEIIVQQKPRILSKCQEYPNWEIRDLTKDVKSWVGLPLIYNGNVIGLLTLDHTQPGFYTEADRDLLTSFAVQAAIAMQNAQLIKQERVLRQQAEILRDTSNALASEGLESALPSIVKAATKLTQTEAGIIYLFDRTKESITYRYEFPDDFGHLPSRFAQKTGLTWEVFNKGEIVEVSDISTNDRISHSMTQSQVKSIIGVPLKLNDEVVGVLFLNSFKQRTFTKNEKALLMTLTGQAAIALERVRLYEQIREQKTAQTMAVHEIAHSITVRTNLKDVLESIIQWSITLMGEANLGEIRLFDEKTNELYVAACRGEAINKQYQRLPLDKGITGQAARERQTIYEPDILRESSQFIRAVANTRSEVAVPLIWESKLLGVLNIEHPLVDAFSPEDINLVEAIARLTSVAIQNNSLFEELENKASRFRHLLEVTSTTLAQPFGLEKVLSLIVQSLSEIFGKNYCVIRLYDAEKNQLGKRITANIGNLVEEKEHKSPRSNGISQQVLKTKQPYYVTTRMHISDPNRPMIRSALLKQGIQTTFAMPILHNTAVIGILYLYLTDFHQFSQNDAQILELFANQASAVITNVQQREKEIKVIRDIASSIYIAAPQGRDEVLKSIINVMMTLMGKSAMVVIRLLDKETNELVVAALQGKTQEEFRDRIKAYEGISGWVAQHKKPANIPDIWNDERYLPGLRGAKSELAVPMLRNEDLIGVLNMVHTQASAFSDSDVELAQAVASLIVVALDNAELYTEMEHRVAEYTKAWKAAHEKMISQEKLMVMNEMGHQFAHRMSNLAGTIPGRINEAKEKLNPLEPKEAWAIGQFNRIADDLKPLLQASNEIKDIVQSGYAEPVNLNHLLNSVVNEVRSSLLVDASLYKVQKNLATDVPILFLEKSKLRAVLFNLVRNAFEAMPGGGTLTILTRAKRINKDAFVEVTIADTGVGIPVSDLSKVFELLYTTRKTGLGFGLWYTQQIIKIFGGEIVVQSTEKVGTTFIITIPGGKYDEEPKK